MKTFDPKILIAVIPIIRLPLDREMKNDNESSICSIVFSYKRQPEVFSFNLNESLLLLDLTRKEQLPFFLRNKRLFIELDAELQLLVLC